MRERIITLPGAGIVADSGVALDWTPEVFQPEYWRRRGATAGQAARGRGAVLFMETEFGEWAFRHYRRGGLVGRILEDHYVWLGMNRTRSIREWRLLKRLFEEGLPVPRPIAACFQRRGGSYTADLITRRIPGARPLSADDGEQRSAAGRVAARCWAPLLARIDECLPLVCPRCGEPMRIIAFILEREVIEGILRHIGEETEPPRAVPSEYSIRVLS